MYKIVRFIWQLPQNILGLLMSINKKPKHTFKNTKIFIIKKEDGFSCGDYVFVNPDCVEGNLLRHEYGHVIQSKILGPFYLLLIFIPSFLWCYVFFDLLGKKTLEEYYCFYTESTANKLVRKIKKITNRNLYK